MKVKASPRKKQTSKCNKFRFSETERHRTKTGPNLHSRVREQNSTQSPSSTKITISISFPPWSFQFTVCYKPREI